MFGLSTDEWNIIESLAICKLKSQGAKVWIFGSRSRGDNNRFSDVDLLYSPSTTISDAEIFEIKSSLEESNLPYKVDLVDIKDLADSYRENVMNDRKMV